MSYFREDRKKKPTALWYLVPISCSFAGGLIAYVVVINEDKEMARNLLILGIVMFFAYLLIGWYAIVNLLRRFGIFPWW